MQPTTFSDSICSQYTRRVVLAPLIGDSSDESDIALGLSLQPIDPVWVKHEWQ